MVLSPSSLLALESLFLSLFWLAATLSYSENQGLNLAEVSGVLEVYCILGLPNFTELTTLSLTKYDHFVALCYKRIVRS